MRRAFAVILGVFALLAGAVAAWGVIQFNRISRVDVDLTEAGDMSPQNFLVVGSDTRDLGHGSSGEDNGAIYGDGNETAPGGKRADTILIARADPKRGTIELLSIPRDLWVTDPSGDSHRINGSYNEGAQNLVDTIESNLDIPIHHYVEVNFNGFKGLVESLGGVDMYFDRPVRDSFTGLNIRKKGCYTLDGVQALAFARSRHLVYSNGVKWISDGSGDLGRITRQQVFLRHALSKVSKLGLGDVDSLRVLTGVAVNNVKIDDSLGTRDMIRFGRAFAKVDASKMVVHRLTTTPFRAPNGQDVLKLSTADSRPVLDIFSGKAKPTDVTVASEPALTPQMVTVDVLNGTSIAGLAKSGGDRLKAVGFNIGNVDNSEPVSSTVVTYGKGGERRALLVASRISPNPDVKKDSTLAAGQVVVKLAGELNVPATSTTGPSTSGTPTTAGVGQPSTSGAGTATPEKTVGLLIGDPPPGSGIKCGV